MEAIRGYVAMLDVLGFAQLVARESQSEELNKYIEAVRQATAGPGVEFVLFSDTIVLTTTQDDDDALIAVIRSCSNLLSALLGAEIPVRGAVAHGSFFRLSDRERGSVFLAGRPLVDAYRFEKAQDWVGIMLTASVVRRIPSLGERCDMTLPSATKEEVEKIVARFPWPLYVQRCTEIPFQASEVSTPGVYQGFAIVPTMTGLDTEHGMAASLSDAILHLQRLREVAPEPKSQRKYDRTISWLWALRANWESIGRLWERFGLKWARRL
jgi:hypothetical protein